MPVFMHWFGSGLLLGSIVPQTMLHAIPAVKNSIAHSVTSSLAKAGKVFAR